MGTTVSTNYVELPKNLRKLDAKGFLPLVPKIRRSSPNPLSIVCRVLNDLTKRGYSIGEYLSSGSFKDVFTLRSREGIPCVAKVSHGGCTYRSRNGPPCVCPVPNHHREIKRQQKSAVRQFVLQCRDHFSFKLCGLDHVYVEIQEQGVPAIDCIARVQSKNNKSCIKECSTFNPRYVPLAMMCLTSTTTT